jgi:hypothetical protein
VVVRQRLRASGSDHAPALQDRVMPRERDQALGSEDKGWSSLLDPRLRDACAGMTVTES